MPGFAERGAAFARTALYGLLGARRVHRMSHPIPDRNDAVADRDAIERFHRLLYDGGTLNDTYWLGRPVLKTPQDCWVYQEILTELRPDLVVETGTYLGGSALFFASVCDLLGHGQILTIDDKRRIDARHPRVTMLVGDSTSDGILERVRSTAAHARTVLVVLDADHRADAVLREMRSYAPLVTVGSYLVVEDTNVNGHPVFPDHGPGPAEAVEVFLRERSDFVADRSREKFLVTFFPGGWLKRIRTSE